MPLDLPADPEALSRRMASTFADLSPERRARVAFHSVKPDHLNRCTRRSWQRRGLSVARHLANIGADDGEMTDLVAIVDVLGDWAELDRYALETLAALVAADESSAVLARSDRERAANDDTGASPPTVAALVAAPGAPSLAVITTAD